MLMNIKLEEKKTIHFTREYFILYRKCEFILEEEALVLISLSSLFTSSLFSIRQTIDSETLSNHQQHGLTIVR